MVMLIENGGKRKYRRESGNEIVGNEKRRHQADQSLAK
jgi:hypothetical protein